MNGFWLVGSNNGLFDDQKENQKKKWGPSRSRKTTRLCKIKATDAQHYFMLQRNDTMEPWNSKQVLLGSSSCEFYF